jgi:hypothetical protein
MLTPPEVRRASLWALGGAVLAFIVAPLLAPHARLLSNGISFAGSMMWLWKLGHIAFGSPGWFAGQPGEYDERESAERYRAMAISYIIVTAVIVLGSAFFHFGRSFGLNLPAFLDLPKPDSVLVTFALMALPGIVHAWRSKRIEAAVEDED